MTAKATNEPVAIVIPPIELATIEVQVVGDTRLVMHRMSEEAKESLRHTKPAKRASGPKKVRDPLQECIDALHVTPDGKPCMPSMAFKGAMQDAALLVKGATKVDVKRLVTVVGDYVVIEGDPEFTRHDDGEQLWNMREDVTRLSGPSRAPSVTWRPEFEHWTARMTIITQPDLLPVDAVVNLLNWAGAFIGIGENRPGKSGGNWGKFHVA